MTDQPGFAKLSAERHREELLRLLPRLLRYEPNNGKLFWLERPVEMFPTQGAASWWNARFAGKEALNTDNHGYYSGTILRRGYLTHRVIWALIHGAWPPEAIDHINGDKSDNRLSNLRSVPHAENSRNTRLRTDNTSGRVGVYWCRRKSKWRAHIYLRSGRYKHLGYFVSFDEACVARATAERENCFHENHGRKAA